MTDHKTPPGYIPLTHHQLGTPGQTNRPNHRAKGDRQNAPDNGLPQRQTDRRPRPQGNGGNGNGGGQQPYSNGGGPRNDHPRDGGPARGPANNKQKPRPGQRGPSTGNGRAPD